MNTAAAAPAAPMHAVVVLHPTCSPARTLTHRNGLIDIVATVNGATVTLAEGVREDEVAARIVRDWDLSLNTTA